MLYEASSSGVKVVIDDACGHETYEQLKKQIQDVEEEAAESVSSEEEIPAEKREANPVVVWDFIVETNVQEVLR